MMAGGWTHTSGLRLRVSYKEMVEVTKVVCDAVRLQLRKHQVRISGKEWLAAKMLRGEALGAGREHQSRIKMM
jgi:hypothetical protein